jgi:putative AdoMet-dependent methyltransferase
MFPNLQFPPEEFDQWAAHYDQNVGSNAGFPFDGYARVLETIVDRAAIAEGAWVLDLGTGTGNLAQLFARRGCKLWGLDFSAPMLEKAQIKLPAAQFAQVDIRAEWPLEFRRRYHAIVSGYTFHHFPLQEKVELVIRLVNEHLLPGGCLLIGDIAFQDAAEEDALRRAMGPEWDQEYYWLADETLTAFTRAGIRAKFIRISSCAGVFRFTIQRIP